MNQLRKLLFMFFSFVIFTPAICFADLFGISDSAQTMVLTKILTEMVLNFTQGEIQAGGITNMATMMNLFLKGTTPLSKIRYDHMKSMSSLMQGENSGWPSDISPVQVAKEEQLKDIVRLVNNVWTENRGPSTTDAIQLLAVLRSFDASHRAYESLPPLSH